MANLITLAVYFDCLFTSLFKYFLTAEAELSALTYGTCE